MPGRESRSPHRPFGIFEASIVLFGMPSALCVTFAVCAKARASRCDGVVRVTMPPRGFPVAARGAGRANR